MEITNLKEQFGEYLYSRLPKVYREYDVDIKRPVVVDGETVYVTYKTLEEYLKAYDSTYTNENSEYKICLKNQTGKNKVLLTVNKVFKNSYSFNDFIKEFEQNYSPDAPKNSLNDLSEYDICLLPLMSQLKMNENINNESFSSLLNIAYKTLLRYN